MCPRCGRPTDAGSWAVRREDSNPWVCVGCAERAAVEDEDVAALDGVEAVWTQRNNMDERRIEYMDESGTVMRARAMTLFERRQAAKSLPPSMRKGWLEAGREGE